MMNRPGRRRGNWLWHFERDALDSETAARLMNATAGKCITLYEEILRRALTDAGEGKNARTAGRATKNEKALEGFHGGACAARLSGSIADLYR
jgi:hypothetical protein